MFAEYVHGPSMHRDSYAGGGMFDRNIRAHPLLPYHVGFMVGLASGSRLAIDSTSVRRPTISKRFW
jgi:hypothetical protein